MPQRDGVADVAPGAEQGYEGHGVERHDHQAVHQELCVLLS